MNVKRSHAILLLAAALALAAATLAGSGSGASAQGGRTLSLTELDQGATFKHVRNTKTRSSRANPAGDIIVFTNRVADGSGKVVGKVHNVCVTTDGARNFVDSVVTCHGTLVLGDGTLTFQLARRIGSDSGTGAVTGGTGGYAGANGSFVVDDQANGDSLVTITLAG
jgi:hypothetical protein